MPAALVEVGFLSNTEEAGRLATSDAQDQIAAALADALVEYLRAPTAVAEATAVP